jgi:Na+/citrate or Na+/malate symporter
VGPVQEVITAGMGEGMMILSSSWSSSAGSARSRAHSSARCWSALLQNYVAFLEPKLALISQHCADDGDPDVAAAGHDARCEGKMRCW